MHPALAVNYRQEAKGRKRASAGRVSAHRCSAVLW